MIFNSITTHKTVYIVKKSLIYLYTLGIQSKVFGEKYNL